MKSRLENSIWFKIFSPYIRLMFGLFVGNSSSILTDMASAVALAPYSTAAQARAISPTGPIESIPDMISSVLLNFQEATMKLNYILGGKMTAPASLTAPTGGLLTTGDDSATYNLLVSIFQMLK